MDWAIIKTTLEQFIYSTLRNKTAPVRREAAKLLRSIADTIDKETASARGAQDP